ncbi:MAG: 3D domain-containing protein [Deltaproteobacteria bacterium]|nr:3D domain-containing protein [Deltaproteobacteria bacterium]
MRHVGMSIALAAAIILLDSADVSVPILSMSGAPVRALASANAAVPPWLWFAPRTNFPVVMPRAEAARPRGYAIPADHPHPPLGRFKLTAYSGPKGKARALTATGTSARAGRTVAVDPKVIPLGSRIYIDGIGERIAEDVGPGVKGQHIDVFLSSFPAATRFGVQRRAVSVIAPADAS